MKNAMKLNKARFWVWPVSLGAGFSLAYSIACHWFGFLSASKINRLELLVVFGAIFIVLYWQLVKYSLGILSGRTSMARTFLLLGVAVIAAGAFALVVLPSFQDQLISAQIQAGASLTSTTRLLWMALKLSDFVSLAGLLVFGEVTLSFLASHWQFILPIIPRGLAVFFPLGMLLLVGVAANLVISATGKLGVLNKLTPLTGNGLIALDEGSNNFFENIRVYTILFENYQGWTLVTPADLLKKLDIDPGGKLKTWGRIKSIETFNYLAELPDQEMKDLLALNNVNVENGLGLHYIAILVDDPARKICFRTYKEKVFIVPVSLSPVCENK